MHPSTRKDRDLALDGLFEWVQARWFARAVFAVLAAWGFAYTTVLAQAVVWWVMDPEGLSGFQLLGFAMSYFAVIASLQHLVVLFIPAVLLLSTSELRKSVRFVWLVSTVCTLGVTAAGFVSLWLPAAGCVGCMFWARKRYPLVPAQEEPWGDLP